MTHVTGIGGVFMKASDPEALKAWYRQHLGIDAGPYGANFFWFEDQRPERRARTVWSVFTADTEYFGPGDQQMMVNYRVRDLSGLLVALRDAGVTLAGEAADEGYGRFAWIVDPEGRRVELWEPPDEDDDRAAFGEVSS